MDRDLLFLQRFDKCNQFAALGGVLQRVVVVSKDRIRVGLQVYGRNLGDMGDYEPTLDWAFVDYRFQDWLGARAGRLKLAHAFYNEYRDYDMLRTPIILPSSIFGTSFL